MNKTILTQSPNSFSVCSELSNLRKGGIFIKHSAYCYIMGKAADTSQADIQFQIEISIASEACCLPCI